MDLSLGCREEVGTTWLYHLRDGSTLEKKEWIELVEQHVRESKHESILKGIEDTIRLWNKKETVYEVALQVYASKYCTKIEHINKPQKVEFKVVKDNMGYDQLSL